MMAETVTIHFEGRPMEARKGESLAAALVGHGELSFRDTRLGRERGVFCGMGVCQDCLVEVDGQANVRACMVKVEAPLTVRRETHMRPLPLRAQGAAPSEIGSVRVEEPGLLVVGAGPGGLAAAIAARRAGLAVTLVDERATPGGQYYKQLAVDAVPGPDGQHRAGQTLIAEAIALGIDMRMDTLVWGAFEPREFVTAGRQGPVRILPRAAVVATGAYERPWPVPGWTLPGVMTTGAAQSFWRTARRLPGRRVLIAGNGPLNLQLAAELIDGGATIAAIAEAAPRPGMRAAADILRMLRASPGLVGDGAAYALKRRRAGVPMLHGHVLASVEATGSGLRASLRPSDGGEPDQTIEADVICLGYGFEPSNELLRVLGCAHDWDAERRQLATRRDAQGRTSVAGVFALGDCAGLGGAKVALAEGTIAGLAAAADLGSPLSPELERMRQEAEALRERHHLFQAALWRVYAAPPYTPALGDRDTVVCRCEEVTLGEVEDALAEGLSAIGSVKRRTRLGMGRCQGRYCAPVVDGLMAGRAGIARHEFSGFAPRVPVKPVTIADLAYRGAD